MRLGEDGWRIKEEISIYRRGDWCSGHRVALRNSAAAMEFFSGVHTRLNGLGKKDGRTGLLFGVWEGIG